MTLLLYLSDHQSHETVGGHTVFGGMHGTEDLTKTCAVRAILLWIYMPAIDRPLSDWIYMPAIDRSLFDAGGGGWRGRERGGCSLGWR